MSDMPSFDDLKIGVENLYVADCRKRNLKVYSGTLLPIYGWRTYAAFRDDLRNEFNQWLRSSDCFDGCVDFDKTVRNPQDTKSFAAGFDSGDHLHPSKDAYRAMAKAAADFIEKKL